MDKNNFKISYYEDQIIIIEKCNQKISITKTIDNDLFFGATQDILAMEFKLYSRNQEEYQMYMILENLVKSIIGRYILTDDYKNDFLRLPKDFIDLETKTIIWHSYSGIDDILKIEYSDTSIKISLLKDSSTKEYTLNSNVSVRIRTKGSNYKYYYQEFIPFFSGLSLFARKQERKNGFLRTKTNQDKK